MAIQTLTLNVNAQPSAEDRAFLYLSQNENGRDIRFRILGDDLPSGCTATLSGVKPDGNVWSKAGTVTNNFVVVEEDIQMTAVAGRWDAQLDIVNGSKNIVTALIRITVEAAAVEAGAVPSDTQLEGYVEQCKQYAETAKNEAYGSPLTAATAAAMTDQSRVYVYTGSETGYTAGHWYYHNGTSWTDGGVYNAVAVDTDTTLSVSGKAADAKKTGDEISQIKEELSAMSTATSSDAGKALKAKTVANGKVTEWEFGEAGASVELDATLTDATKAAQAKVVGDKLTEIANQIRTETAQTAESSADNWRLNTNGYSAYNNQYKLVKYAITAGARIKIVSDDKFQFQTSSTVPSSGTLYRIGETYETGTFELVAPETATYLIVSTLKTNSTASVSLISEITADDITDLNERINTINDALTEYDPAKAMSDARLSQTIGENMYISNDVIVTTPNAANRGHTDIQSIKGRRLQFTVDPEIRVALYYQTENNRWTTVSYQSGTYVCVFPDSADRFFFQLLTISYSAELPTDRTLITASWLEIDSNPLAKKYIYDAYRQRAEVLKIQKSSTNEGNVGSLFKAMLISDVHMGKGRMSDVINLVKNWGTDYFDVLINCGDTCNNSSDNLAWYDELTSELPIPHVNTVGNHDWSDAVTTYGKIIAPITSQTGIVQPTGAAGNGLCYYYMDTTNVRLIVLNCMAWDADQATWFETVLDDAITNNKYVICISHYRFSAQYSTHLECNWCIRDGYSQVLNIQAAEKVKSFKDNGGVFLCWLVGHDHADNLHVLRGYGNQLIVTIPSFTTRATYLYPNGKDTAYNYDVMTYFTVDSYFKILKLMRIGADIDMYGVRHQGVSLNYDTGELIASW